MSAPEMNARSPAPRSTSTRTAGSPSTWDKAPGRAACISTESALCFSGWLNVIVATPSRNSTRSLPVPESYSLITDPLDGAAGPQLGDLVGGEAQLGQDGRGVT